MMAPDNVGTWGEKPKGWGEDQDILNNTAIINELDLTDKRVGIDKIKNYDDK